MSPTSEKRRIYWDNAATTWPKPACVYDAVDHFQREVGAPSGRSGYRDALESNRIVQRARRGVAALLGLQDMRQLIFTGSGTDSLNLAIFGLLGPGDHVVTTVCEHNSVLRPLHALAETANVAITYVPCDGQGFVSPDDVRDALQPQTRLVAVVHGSNVTGAVQPVEEIGRIVRQHDAYFLIDAAQTLGHVPLDFESTQADLIAAPGHKGLLGPLGTGILAIRPTTEQQLKPLRLGGTGSRSHQEQHPGELPDKYEPGNHNTLGLAGLDAGSVFLRSRTVDACQEHHRLIARRLLDGLGAIDGVTILGPTFEQPRTSVVSLTLKGYDPQQLAAFLEVSAGIQCRAGLHCAPRMHAALGTIDSGGTVRLSAGWATTTADVDTALEAIAAAAGCVVH